MQISPEELTTLVGDILKRLDAQGASGAAASPAPASQWPRPESGRRLDGIVFETVDQAVAAAGKAQKVFQELGLEARRRIIQAMRKTGVQNAEPLAKYAHQETGMGRWADKVKKNLAVSLKTPGPEDLRADAYTGDKGLTLVEYAPFGVCAAITPSTNPTSTIINNAISILSGGNAVVFSPHPASRGCVHETMRLLTEAVEEAGGPRGLMTTVKKPTVESTKDLLAHPDVPLNMVTGGPAIVKVALTVGKTCKTIAAGPGNPPVVVDETAEFPKCAQDVITGASFDNGVLCTAEKQTICVGAAYDKFVRAMQGDPRAFELTKAQFDELTKKIIKKGGKGCKDPVLERKYIGKDAAFIAKEALGLDIPGAARLLWGQVPQDHAYVWTEQLMPVHPVTKAATLDEAIELAYHTEGYNHHTAAMHSTHVGNLTKMGRRMACSIFVKNAPTIYGLGMGEGYATMSIGTPTGDGLTKASHFVRPLQCSMVGYLRIA